MTSEEIFKLVLDYVDSIKETKELVSKLEELRKTAEETGNQALTGLASKASDLTKRFSELKIGGKDAADALSGVANAGLDFFKSFKEGNPAGIAESVARLAELVPGINQFAGGIRTAGVFAAAAYPVVRDWYDMLKKQAKEMADSTRDIKAYTAAIEDQTRAMKESGAVEKAREADQASAGTPGSRQAARAELFGLLTKGSAEASLNEIYEAIHTGEAGKRKEQYGEIESDYQKALAQITAKEKQQGAHYVNTVARQAAIKKRAEAMAGVGADEQSRAEELFKRAQAGDDTAMEELQRLLPEGSTTREVARMSSRQGMAEQARARAAAEEQRVANIKQREEQKRQQHEAEQAKEKTLKEIHERDEGLARSSAETSVRQRLQTKKEGDDAAAQIRDMARRTEQEIKERQREQQELQQRLGPEWLGSAADFAGGPGNRNIQRAEIARAAMRRLIEGGMDKDAASALIERQGGALMDSLSRRPKPRPRPAQRQPQTTGIVENQAHIAANQEQFARQQGAMITDVNKMLKQVARLQAQNRTSAASGMN